MADWYSECDLFTFLHLSDLHRSPGDPISNTDLVSALVADSLRFSHETPSISKPDAIIVSGDLVRGVPLESPSYPTELVHQYEEALEFLVSVTSMFLGGDRSRLVMIPGNHDVDWNMARRAMTTVAMDGKDIRALIEAPNSPFRWCWRTRQLFEITDPALYGHRFDYFVDTYERFYAGTNLVFPLSPRRPWNLYSLDGGKIIVGAFNSCMTNDCYSYHGNIPTSAISDSHLALLNAHAAPALRIAVWHHDVQGPPLRSDYMDRDTVRLMIDKGFRVGLHGHQHKSEAGPLFLYTAEKQQMAVVSAGSLCAGSEEIPPGFQRQYNVIEIADYVRARVHVRQSQLPGIFSQGILPGLGNPSFADVDWTPAPEGAFVNVARGGGIDVGALELVEKLIASGRYSEAASSIDHGGRILGNSGRLLKTEALFLGREWRLLTYHLADPSSEDELAKAVRALIELREFDRADALLVDNSKGLSTKLIEDLQKTVRAERTMAK